jgi:hypothetical protein
MNVIVCHRRGTSLTGIAVGGAVNIVTRSGSNDFHGSAYFFFRDHNLAAYPGLKRSTFNPNPFFARRNPGAWLGGPAVKDKFFFFFSYEHLNQTSVITEQNDLPSLQALNAIWPSPLHYKRFTARVRLPALQNTRCSRVSRMTATRILDRMLERGRRRPGSTTATGAIKAFSDSLAC